MKKRTLPRFNPDKHVNESPHIVILGAGASRASFPNGDKNGRMLPLMDDFAETIGLQNVFKSGNINYVGRNFEELYDEISHSHKDTKFLEMVQKKVYDYFAQIEIPDELTIYDQLLMSLRKKDIIVTFNWDPLLVQAYKRNGPMESLPEVRFLHGNVAVGICKKDKVFGNIENCCSKCGKKFEQMQLLYPIKDKDYDLYPAISEEWRVLRQFIKHAYFITIFGYSSPKNDVSAIEIMKKVWDTNTTKELAEIEIIDIKPREELLKSWQDFIVSHHYRIYRCFEDSYLFNNPRRSCDTFASSSLQCEFLKKNPIPLGLTLNEFHEWLKPLLNEEGRFIENEEGFSLLPCDEILKKIGKN